MSLSIVRSPLTGTTRAMALPRSCQATVTCPASQVVGTSDTGGGGGVRNHRLAGGTGEPDSDGASRSDLDGPIASGPVTCESAPLGLADLEPYSRALMSGYSDEQLAVECGHCRKSVSAEIVGSAVEYDENGDVHRTLLVECPACKAPNLVGQFVEQNGDEFDKGPPHRLWPSPPRQLSVEAPVAIREDFAEAQRCMSVDAHTAAAVMVRRVLEGIAADQEATGRVLADQLKSLESSGAIDGRLAEWADALRVVGNSAAHSGSGPTSREDASDAIAFAEALANHVYTFRAQFDRFKARRAGGSSSSVRE